MAWAIEYDSLSVTNGEPVGTVFAKASPLVNAWTYTKDPADATVFATEQLAQSVAAKRSWNNARVVLVDDRP